MLHNRHPLAEHRDTREFAIHGHSPGKPFVDLVAHIVICRQDGRGWFPVYGTASQNLGQIHDKNPNRVRTFYIALHEMNIYKQIVRPVIASRNACSVPSHWAQDRPSATMFICDHNINVSAINGGNPLPPLCSWNRRYPLILLYTSAGTALVPRNITAYFGIVTPTLQFWPAFARPLLETGTGSDIRCLHLTTNA